MTVEKAIGPKRQIYFYSFGTGILLVLYYILSYIAILKFADKLIGSSVLIL